MQQEHHRIVHFLARVSPRDLICAQAVRRIAVVKL